MPQGGKGIVAVAALQLFWGKEDPSLVPVFVHLMVDACQLTLDIQYDLAASPSGHGRDNDALGLSLAAAANDKDVCVVTHRLADILFLCLPLDKAEKNTGVAGGSI